jgi:hypothetical protein
MNRGGRTRTCNPRFWSLGVEVPICSANAALGVSARQYARQYADGPARLAACIWPRPGRGRE